jgi:predicted Zn-dependent peptidase
MTFLCCAPERASENLQRILQVQRTLQQEGATESELELARNKICSHLVRSSERPSSRLFSVGNGWIQRRSYQTVQERLIAYQRVELTEVNAILEKFPLTVNTTIAVGPLENITRPV